MQPAGTRSAWLILTVALANSVAASLNQFKAPPIMPLLMDAFHLTASHAGLLMSCFAITGLLLAIPVGFILQKLGPRKTGLIAISFVAGGSLLGALSRSMELMLGSRFLEGAGMSFISVVSPSLIAVSFAESQRGKAMGILAAWVPLGSSIMFLLGPYLAGSWGWRSVWWFGFVYSAIAGALYFLLVRPAPQTSGNEEALQSGDIGKVLANRNVWLIAVLFGCFNFVFLAFVTWAPTFLNEIRHKSLANASFLISLITILAIILSPIAGWISDRIGSRKLICVVPMFLLMLLFPLMPRVSDALLYPFFIAVGVMTGFIPTGVFSAGAEVLEDKRLSGMVMAVILTGQYAGMLLGPFVFGSVMGSSAGWSAAFWTLAPLSAVGAIAGWMAAMTPRRQEDSPQSHKAHKEK